MSTQSVILFPNPLQSISSASVLGTYQSIGNPLPNPSRIIKIVNNSNEDVTVSWDGINDHDFVPKSSFTLYDSGTNRANSASSLEVPANTTIFVKGTAGVGTIFLVSFFASNSSNS